MQVKRVTALRAWRSALPAIAALVLAVVMTWPLAYGLGSLGRTGVGPNADPHFGTNGDGMFSLWNVAWVARTIVADPGNLFQANIFHPHRDALAFSEANIVAGVIGVPAWWATKNPYATLNVVILVAFASAWFFMWKLALYLTGNRGVAATAAAFFAFCPYVFAHTAHIQLMITGGIPLAMLMLHHIADRPTWRYGAGLGVTLLVQALACAYYGIFAALMVGFAIVFFTISRSLARNKAWWTAIAVAAAVSIAGVAPFLYPYYEIRQDAGFERSLQESVRYSANLTSYLASSAYAHQWLLDGIARWPRWTEVMFPGFLPVGLALTGLTLAAVRSRSGATRERETVFLYGSLGALAFWASFGPAAGLYSLLFHTVPVFSFLRAPSRMAIVVVICLAVLAALGLRRVLNGVPERGRRLVAAVVAVAAIAELATGMPWERAVVAPGVYDIAASLPKRPLAEFPFYGGRSAWHLHTQYMLFSTAHWMPMMNGYSDYTPPQFREDSVVLDGFPSDDSFAVLEKARVRYIGVHWDMFGPRAEEIRTRLRPFRPHLSLLAASPRMSIYEIVSFP
jgi:hypothetical protein